MTQNAPYVPPRGANIAGAGYIRRTWHITLPGLAPTIVLMTTLALGQILNACRMCYAGG